LVNINSIYNKVIQTKSKIVSIESHLYIKYNNLFLIVYFQTNENKKSQNLTKDKLIFDIVNKKTLMKEYIFLIYLLKYNENLFMISVLQF
jgi:hypothetical protein